MDASGQQSEEWFRPDKYSVWAYDREGRGTPILLVLYEWEIEGLSLSRGCSRRPH